MVALSPDPIQIPPILQWIIGLAGACATIFTVWMAALRKDKPAVAGETRTFLGGPLDQFNSTLNEIRGHVERIEAHVAPLAEGQRSIARDIAELPQREDIAIYERDPRKRRRKRSR